MVLKERTEEQRHKLRHTELEIEEADVPQAPAKVHAPSPEEHNRHCATHLSCRNWCPICVQAKKRNPAHRHTASDKANKLVPVIAMDHMYMNETTDDTNNPTLVTHESCGGGAWAASTTKKGDCAHVKHKVTNIIRGLGYSNVVIKSDQEPAVRGIERNVAKSRRNIHQSESQPPMEPSRTPFNECKEKSEQSHWTSR